MKLLFFCLVATLNPKVTGGWAEFLNTMPKFLKVFLNITKPSLSDGMYKCYVIGLNCEGFSCFSLRLQEVQANSIAMYNFFLYIMGEPVYSARF